MSGSPAAQRIDKWLWHARFARTRGAAQQLAVSGHVRLNREKVASASRLVRVGDVLTLALNRNVLVIRVCAIAERRGPAEQARMLYRSEAAATEDAADTTVAAAVQGKGPE